MKEVTISKKPIYQGKIFSVHEDQVLLENGTKTTREVVEHSGGVCVYAQIANQVLMVTQYRYPFDKEVLELPAGKLEVDEDPKTAAIRELQEETGYLASDLIEQGIFMPSCAYLSEKIYLFEARNLKFVGQRLDDNEFLACQLLDIAELKNKIKQHKIEDGKTIALCLKVWLN